MIKNITHIVLNNSHSKSSHQAYEGPSTTLISICFLCRCFWKSWNERMSFRNVPVTFLCSVIERKCTLLRWGGGGALEGCWFFSCPPLWWLVETVEFLPTSVTYPPLAWWCSLMEHLQALEQEAGRTGTYKPQTSFLSLTETWCRVIWEGTG